MSDTVSEALTGGSSGGWGLSSVLRTLGVPFWDSLFGSFTAGNSFEG